MTFIKHDGFEEIFISFYLLGEKGKGFQKRFTLLYAEIQAMRYLLTPWVQSASSEQCRERKRF